MVGTGSKVGNLCEHLFEEHSPVRLKVLKEKRQDRLTDSPRAAFLMFRIVQCLWSDFPPTRYCGTSYVLSHLGICFVFPGPENPGKVPTLSF